MPNVQDVASSSLTQAEARAPSLVRRIAAIDARRPPSAERLEALALGLVDALLDADDATLREALAALRSARARAIGVGQDGSALIGWLDSLLAVAHWGLERVAETAAVARGTRAWEFLDALSDAGRLGSSELRERLETDETQVSRTGRQLLEAGLVGRSRAGRNVNWQITPRGRRALELAGETEPATRDTSFWMEAIRRGFEAAGGDEPGQRRSVDPTRELIVESTLALHDQLGITQTSWDAIAARADVPLETVRQHFPTLDDLVMGCGSHLLSSLRLPPPERAAEAFGGADTRPERVRRLVELLFDVYERRGVSLAGGHDVAAELPLVADSMATVDSVIDALVAEAIGPDAQSAESVASVRALTDLVMWSALRERGLSPGAAVDQAAATVERWLETRPSGSLRSI